MTNREVIKLIKSLKNDPDLGGGFDVKKSWGKFVEKYDFEKDFSETNLTWHDYTEYISHIGSRVVLKPAGALASIFVLVVSGWVGAVNVSLASVPGDLLYPVKMATERTQLILTATSEQRARLHAEFAGRRLDEAMDISLSSRSNKEELMKTAVDSFRTEVVSVTDELKNVSSAEGAQAVTELAEAVDRKAEEYSAVIGQSSEDVTEVTAVVVEAQEQVTETVVTEHEEQPEQETAEYLDTAFQKDTFDIRNRVDMLSIRLSRIETTLNSNNAMTDDINNTIKITKTAIKDFSEKIQALSEVFAAGGYRSVFEKISEMKIILTNAETVVADLEIMVTTTN
ncbi:MAG: DUF5667 domain-containing protein [Patescibacteria group bacterium]